MDRVSRATGQRNGRCKKSLCAFFRINAIKSEIPYKVRGKRRMSAIAGLFYRDNRPVDPRDLSRMMDTLAHRGPDGAHCWCKGKVGLGHHMLFTTPESLNE